TVFDQPLAGFAFNGQCQDDSTHFLDTSTATPPGTIVSWDWDFDDPQSGFNVSHAQNPRHIYRFPGTYHVTLMVTTNELCYGTIIIPVIIHPKPVAHFKYTTACNNSKTQFTDASVAPNSQIISWEWNFDDPLSGGSNTSTDQNPYHVYANPGDYHVTLKVTNLFGCKDSTLSSSKVHVNGQPTAGFFYTSHFCKAGMVDFYDSSTTYGTATIASRYWIFEANQTLLTPDPIVYHQFSIPGMTYADTLIVTDNQGCMDTISKSVVVKPAYSFSFSYDEVCFQSPTHFTVIDPNHSAGDSLSPVYWNFDDPTSAQNTSSDFAPSHVFTNPGFYTVRLVAFNTDHCHDTVYKIVEVKKLPVADFTNDPISYCTTSRIMFRNTSKTGGQVFSHFTWDFGDGTTPVTIYAPCDTISHRFGSTDNTYIVTLTAVDTNGCDSTLRKTIVLKCISAGFITAGGNNCQNDSVTFIDKSFPANKITSWSWNFGDSSPLKNYTTPPPFVRHKYAQAGTFTVHLTITSSTTAAVTHDTTIVVKESPVANFATTSVCLKDSVHFFDLATYVTDTINFRKWIFGDNSPNPISINTFNIAHLYANARKYRVQFIVKNQSGCTDTVRDSVEVYGLPKAGFIVPSSICTRDEFELLNITTPMNNNMNWMWAFEDPRNPGTISTMKNPVYVYDSAGTYSVWLRTSDGKSCRDSIRKSVVVKPSPVSSFLIYTNI
ncbi:MAG: PKD domain-containing protein, partial [Bacteroidota bacterium]